MPPQIQIKPTLSQLRAELSRYRKAAKYHSRTGPQEDARCLWERVAAIESKIQEYIP